MCVNYFFRSSFTEAQPLQQSQHPPQDEPPFFFLLCRLKALYIIVNNTNETAAMITQISTAFIQHPSFFNFFSDYRVNYRRRYQRRQD